VLMLRVHSAIRGADWLPNQSWANVEEIFAALDRRLDPGAFARAPFGVVWDHVILPAVLGKAPPISSGVRTGDYDHASGSNKGSAISSHISAMAPNGRHAVDLFREEATAGATGSAVPSSSSTAASSTASSSALPSPLSPASSVTASAASSVSAAVHPRSIDAAAAEEFSALEPLPSSLVTVDLFCHLLLTKHEYRSWWIRKGRRLQP